MSNRPHSIATAQAVNDDEVIDIVGQLTGVQVKTDKNKKTYYNVCLSGDGKRMYGNVWMNHTPEPLMGQTVIARNVKMGTWNGNRNFSAARGGTIEEFSEDMDAPPQKAPQNRPAPSGHTGHAPAPQVPAKATGTAKLGEYAALYAACLGSARHAVSEASFDDSPETIRNIASCFFIQAIKDGVRVEGGAPQDEKVPF